MERKYYIVQNGQQLGPFSLFQLQNQKILPETLCWYEDLDKWTKVSELPELSILLKYSTLSPPFSVLPPQTPLQGINQVQSTKKGDFMGYEYYLLAWQKYVQFSGRSRRKEFWYFYLFHLLITFVFMVFIEANPYQKIYSSLYGLYWLASLIPTLAVFSRRMHDVGESGWFMLIPFLNIVLACKSGDTGANKYGKDPKS